MSEYQNNSIFWVETQKISANPFQPRREFSEDSLNDLADSIRQYGVLQPLVVTRKEEETESGGYSVYYELIAGERRLRASRIAGLQQVPVIIRKQTDNKVRLELAIIENLQREDLNPIDRALAFEQLHKEFNLTHAEIGKRMGKSRVYVSNSLRLLSLPEDIREGLISGKITEGHTRPLLMLSDKPEEQTTLFKEIILKKMSVRDSEKIARKIAQDRVRKKEFLVDPRIRDYEVKLSENLGTRVHIEQKERGGKITIDYMTLKDLEKILSSIDQKQVAENEATKAEQFDFLSGHLSMLHKENEKEADEVKDEDISLDKIQEIDSVNEAEESQKVASQENQGFSEEPILGGGNELYQEKEPLATEELGEVEMQRESVPYENPSYERGEEQPYSQKEEYQGTFDHVDKESQAQVQDQQNFYSYQEGTRETSYQAPEQIQQGQGAAQYTYPQNPPQQQVYYGSQQPHYPQGIQHQEVQPKKKGGFFGRIFG